MGGDKTTRVAILLKGCRNLLPIDGLSSNNNVFCEAFLIEKDGRSRMKHKTKAIRATLNPMWHLRIDFGVVALESIGGLVLSVKHSGKFGMKILELGEVVLSPDDLLDMKLRPADNEWYELEPTSEMEKRGWGNRPLGAIRVASDTPGEFVTPQLEPSQRVPSSASAVLAGSRTLSQMATSECQPTSMSFEDDFNPNHIPMLRSASHIPMLSSLQSTSSFMEDHDPARELKLLKRFANRYPGRGETWFVISAPWVQTWLEFVTSPSPMDASLPSAISNMMLVEDSPTGTHLELRRDLQLKHDFRLIDKDSWRFYCLWYGGGPTITVVIPEQIPSVSGWMQSMRLHEHGEIVAG
ncbi:hypothetical protein SPRG_08462 [Saprolegnia parasitica CBS 223.65]|uniref:Uncharacterized protein n=1 Tax=Saprolegnia parasitica (strain CBS 223.65) TaxID=695850 RepID=A0A067CHS3_SAPPC|nr:hypothetical protein SPRG_08462 [Saprolegnia parasitica CBS 223.65]KDO26101.1 hypothetical protein SPRG_08462 [Saprolegnia parasitica CBS 223.65]|eukprot:XP_012203097.1 hypothetical protein SPRG_08462 [Saprolegnia parasitica CBS 223.65]